MILTLAGFARAFTRCFIFAAIVVAPLPIAGCGEGQPAASAPQAASSPTPPATTTPVAVRSSGDEPLATEAGAAVVTLSVKGMSCENCVAGIGGKVAKLPGVRHVRVSLKHATAWVLMDEQLADAGKVQETIGALGYEATVPAAQTP